jgi:hypothetical protein
VSTRYQWVRYQSGENTTEIFNLDQVSHFRHISAGEESVIEFVIHDATYRIMYSVDQVAFGVVAQYIQETTGYQLI